MHIISKIKILGLLVLIFCFSCENHVQESELAEIEQSDCDPDTSFSTSIKPIIDTNCLTCHAGSQFPNLSTYNGVKNNANNIRSQVVSRSMPLTGSLTTEEIDLIKCWIDNGALDN